MTQGDGETVPATDLPRGLLGTRAETFVVLGMLLLVYGVFNGLLVGTFFTLTEGWFQDYANLMWHGQVMYRDFYMFIPPGFPWLMTALAGVLHNSFIAFRVYGILERSLLITLTFLLMRRLFSSRVAFVAVLTAAVVYIGNLQEVFYGYYQSSLLMAVITLFFAVRMWEALDQPTRRYAIACGTFAGITTIFKHSTGVIFTFAVAVAFLIATRKQWPRALNRVLVALGAYVGVLAATASLLAAQGALTPCIRQIFGGASSKGSLGAVLFGFLGRIVDRQTLLLVALCAASALLIALGARLKRGVPHSSFIYSAVSAAALVPAAIAFYDVGAGFWEGAGGYAGVRGAYPREAKVLLVELLVIIAVGAVVTRVLRRRVSTPVAEMVTLAVASLWLVRILLYLRSTPYSSGNLTGLSFLWTERTHINFAVFFLAILYAAYALWLVLSNHGEKAPLKLIIATAGVAIMYIHGMSYIIEDHAVLLSMSLLIGVALSTRTSASWLKDGAIYAACLALVFIVFIQRVNVPYHWWGVNAMPPAYDATSTFADPNLVGFRSSPSYTRNADRIYRAIVANRRPGDAMFTFPHLTYYNATFNMPSPTFAKVTYFDVCSDAAAERDARELKADPPEFLVWNDFSEEEWRIHEGFFRDGAKSGQRSIARVYHELVTSGEYESLGTFTVGMSDPIEVWVKRDGRRIVPSP